MLLTNGRLMPRVPVPCWLPHCMQLSVAKFFNVNCLENRVALWIPYTMDIRVLVESEEIKSKAPDCMERFGVACRQRVPSGGRRKQQARLLLWHGAAAARVQPHGRAAAWRLVERQWWPRCLAPLNRPRLCCLLWWALNSPCLAAFPPLSPWNW